MQVNDIGGKTNPEVYCQELFLFYYKHILQKRSLKIAKTGLCVDYNIYVHAPTMDVSNIMDQKSYYTCQEYLFTR